MVRNIRIGAGTLVLAAVVLLTLSISGPRSSVAAAGLNEVSWESQGWNVSGVNMAWYNWACDFGCGSGSGVSSASSQAAIGARFATLEQTGVHMVRWWMFQDPWQIQTDGSGKPIGIEPQVYQDIDAALQLAETYDLYYTFVLFEFPRNIPSSWMSNVEHREALGQVLGELFANYAGSSRIFAWEVFNEPEWDMWNNVVPAQPVVDTAAVIVDAIHANSSALATVGNAMVDGIPYWTEIGLDFYSPHWYDYMQPGGWCAYCRTADSVRTQYGINAPIVIGEFYAGSDVGGDTRYQQFYDLGYAGAWALVALPGADERRHDHRPGRRGEFRIEILQHWTLFGEFANDDAWADDLRRAHRSASANAGTNPGANSRANGGADSHPGWGADRRADGGTFARADDRSRRGAGRPARA